MGPHGLVVGATGSGKSEMLRTMVASLVINHSPDRLALLLVDFKGGATFADMDPLPHVAGSVTNLADDLSLVDRFKEALYGEMARRQQILSDTGKLPNVDAYEQVRAHRGNLPPLPHLLVIIDEFSELLTAKPDFAELFVAVGRIGRSIGVHLLLATQRLEAARSAAWSPTCRTGSACGPSPRARAARSSACRTRTTCRPNPARVS